MKKRSLSSFKVNKVVAIATLLGFGLGITLFVLLRFIFLSPDVTHYHANFAVFLNNERVTFEGPGYYEEVQSCSSDETSPRGRVHMHQPDNNIAHVHDENVTWGHFFEGLGWALGPETLVTDDQVYVTDDVRTLKFYINGALVDSPYNQVIQNEDQLLISYGENSGDIKAQKAAVGEPVSAEVANTQHDPAACRGSEDSSISARLKNAIW